MRYPAQSRECKFLFLILFLKIAEVRVRYINFASVTRLLLFTLLFGLSGCASTVIETAADAAIAVAKVPFKAGAAVIDVVSGDDDKKQDQDKDKDQDKK